MIHELLRWWIGLGIIALGHVLTLVHRVRTKRYRSTQASLRERYGVEGTPILAWGPQLEARVVEFAEAHDARFAFTSGSTARPKRIAYPASRVRMVKWVYSDTFARCYAALAIRRKSLYVFSALAEDGSLTGILLEEPRLVPFFSGLQAPYRVHAHPAMQALVPKYGASAARLFVLLVSNPGVLYATNPSTLAQFFEHVYERWDETRRLAADFLRDPSAFDPIVRRIRRRLHSVGADARLALATEASAPPVEVLLPGLEAYVCWDGGYVRPFLERLALHLPADRYRHVPMYSMSTETIETIADFTDGVRFLPMAPGVHYELLPEGADDDVERLVSPGDAEVGALYTLVVSDPYGLLRYQTNDLFECVGHVDGVPDLRFVRRRGLEHSFTGEKITGAQLEAAYRELALSTFVTCIPHAAPEPHYELAVVADAVPDGLAERFDRALGAQNEEYASKRKSGRLGAPRATANALRALVARVGGGDDWESQFKLLPLHRERHSG